MTIQCTDKKTFELTDGDRPLGQLSYQSLFSFKATAIIGKDHYEIRPTGFFSTNVSVAQNEMEVANMKMNWKGQIIISYQYGQEFRLKAAGTFLHKYVLEDRDEQKILLLDPDFNWKSFYYNFSVSYDKKPEDILLVLLATYSANYYMAAAAG